MAAEEARGARGSRIQELQQRLLAQVRQQQQRKKKEEEEEEEDGRLEEDDDQDTQADDKGQDAGCTGRKSLSFAPRYWQI